MKNTFMGQFAILFLRYIFQAALCVFAFTSSSCAFIRNDSAPLAQIDAQEIRLSENIKLGLEGWPNTKWWERYGDAQLNELITQAVQSAPSMLVANARIDAARAQASLVNANNGIMVGAIAALNRQGTSENGFLGPYAQNYPKLGLTGPWYTEGIVGLSGTYNVDLWGKNRAQMNAALGIHNAKLAETAQAELLLSARITQTYFDIQALYGAQSLLKEAQMIQSEIVNAHRARAAQGLESKVLTEETLANKLELDKQVIVTESQIRTSHETLRALLGLSPQKNLMIKPQTLPKSIGELPAELGFELLARRPDLQAMRWYIQSSLSEVDAARAAFYPSFDIKAFIGLDSVHLSSLFERSSRQINLIPGLTLPIFDSGRLNANLVKARTNSNVTIALYNEAVINAVREIAQASIELQGLQMQTQKQAAKITAMQFSASSAEENYKRGLVSKMIAWQARLPVLAEQGQQLSFQNQQINAEVTLTMALGGGYRTTDAE